MTVINHFIFIIYMYYLYLLFVFLLLQHVAVPLRSWTSCTHSRDKDAHYTDMVDNPYMGTVDGFGAESVDGYGA